MSLFHFDLSITTLKKFEGHCNNKSLYVYKYVSSANVAKVSKDYGKSRRWPEAIVKSVVNMILSTFAN